MNLFKLGIIFILTLFVVNNTISLIPFQIGSNLTQEDSHCSEHTSSNTQHEESHNSSHDHSRHPCCAHTCQLLGLNHSSFLIDLTTASVDFVNSNSEFYTSQFTKGLFRPPISNIVI